MKKIFLVIVASLFIIISVNAQSQLLPKKFQLNMGVGLSEGGIPVYFGGDYGLDPDITLGAEVSFRRFKERMNKYDYYYHSITGVSGNFNYHFNKIFKLPPKIDLYAGLNIGFLFISSTRNYPGDRRSGVGLGIQLGGRYYINDKIGLNLEFGTVNSFGGGKFGVSFLL